MTVREATRALNEAMRYAKGLAERYDSESNEELLNYQLGRMSALREALKIVYQIDEK